MKSAIGFPVHNPADPSELVGVCTVATSADVHEAVVAADRVRREWARVPVERRAASLASFAAEIRNDLEDLTTLLCREHGKTLAEARAELLGAINVLDWHSGQSDALAAEDISDGRGRMIRQRVPVGVVAIIVPWNYPVLLAQLMIAPALLAGNTVVVKLPDYAPLTLGLVLARLAAALPPGVLNVLAGDGAAVGNGLTTHPKVRKIAFTGSTRTGRAIMRSASSTLKSLSLELGGNDAAIVLPGASITDKLAQELLSGALASAGQVCYAPKRIYVLRSRIGELCDAFERNAQTIVLGDGRAPEVTMGPVNNPAQLAVLQRLLDDAARADATIVPLGRLADNLPERGLFFQPRIVANVGNDANVVQEEQFGPLIPFVAYDTVGEAIGFANDCEYGLSASLWSDNPDEAFDLARELEAGTVFVNVHRVGASAVDMPFGGFKQSGVGRGHGLDGIHEYTELQIVAQRDDMTSLRE